MGNSLARQLQTKFRLSHETYQELLAEADANSDSKLGPLEFKRLVIALKAEEYHSKTTPLVIRAAQHFEMKAAFAEADEDKSGFLEGTELKSIAGKLQKKFGV